MNSKFFKVGFSSAVLVAALSSMTASAATTDVILDIEGNPGCNQMVENQVIYEARVNSPDVGDDQLIDGADIPIGDGSIKYSIASDGITLGFDINVDALSPPGTQYPVNFVILKGAGNAGARVFHYGKSGVLADSGLEAPGSLKSVAFCYGLNGVTVKDGPQEVLNCEDAAADPLHPLYDPDYVPGENSPTTFSCNGALGPYSVHIVEKPELGSTDPALKFYECTCNDYKNEDGQAVACNDGVYGESGLVNGEDGSDEVTSIPPCVPNCAELTDDAEAYLACLEEETLKQAPSNIEFWNTNSGWCTTTLGTRTCYTW